MDSLFFSKQIPAPDSSLVPVLRIGQLLLRFANGTVLGFALFLAHGDKTLALTGPHAFTGIFCGFAIILALARIDAKAMDLRSFRMNRGNGHGRKQRSCGRSHRNT